MEEASWLGLKVAVDRSTAAGGQRIPTLAPSVALGGRCLWFRNRRLALAFHLLPIDAGGAEHPALQAAVELHRALDLHSTS